MKMLVIIVFAMTACGSDTGRYIYDYYGMYRFELPFDHTVTHRRGLQSLSFQLTYSMEQMREKIENAGYTATIYEHDGNDQRMLITAPKDGYNYYFTIYGNTLERLSSSLVVTAPHGEPATYVFLFPNHIVPFGASFSASENSEQRTTAELFASFDYIANFYRNTGKNDVSINTEDKTITFFAEGHRDLNWRRGYVIMSFEDTENGSYVQIHAKSQTENSQNN